MHFCFFSFFPQNNSIFLPPSINIIMRILQRIFIFRQSQTKIPLSLSYPYEYTFSPHQFAFQDVRFTQLPLNRQLAKPQKQHMQLVIRNLEELLNGEKNISNKDLVKQYMTQSLKIKIGEIKSILSESEISMHFKFNLDSINKSTGFIQIKPDDGVSLAEKDLQFIHEYKFDRQKQILLVSLKNKREQISSENQLKKDIEQRMGNNSKEIKDKLQQMAKPKKSAFMDRMMDRVLSIGKQTKKKTQFQNYYLIEQIKGVMECKMTYNNSIFMDNQIPFDSKWLYLVRNLESEDLRKHRRRILFDFQFWNRGNFFPIRNFAAQINQS